jgi:hypothetical protein
MSSKLSPTAEALYSHLPPVCWKTEQTLAKEIGVSRKLIRKAKVELENARKIIIKDCYNGRRSNPRNEILKLTPRERPLSNSLPPRLVAPNIWAGLDRMEMVEQYLNSGWEIVPFQPMGKRPVMPLPRWRMNYATASSALNYFHKHQDVNIGLAVQGMTVVDLDTKEVPNEFSCREFDDTLTSETGRGLQFFFEDDPVVTSSVKVYSPNVDTRCSGSFVVLPPSIHESGFQYRWVTCTGLEKLPVPFRREWRKNYSKRGYFQPFSLPASIPNGERNDTLFRYGRSLRKRGHTFAELEHELNQANAFRCQPPLSSFEMYRLIGNVWNLRDKDAPPDDLPFH